MRPAQSPTERKARPRCGSITQRRLGLEAASRRAPEGASR